MPDDILRPTSMDGFNQGARKVRFDPEAYAHHIAELNLPAEQQLALMRAVWDLMVLFVDAGFGIDGPTLALRGEDNSEAAQTGPDGTAEDAPEEWVP